MRDSKLPYRFERGPAQLDVVWIRRSHEIYIETISRIVEEYHQAVVEQIVIIARNSNGGHQSTWYPATALARVDEWSHYAINPALIIG